MRNCIRVNMKPLGMYITDGKHISNAKAQPKFWLSDEDHPYVPVLSLISVNTEEEIRLCTGEGPATDIVTYNENHRIAKLDQGVVNSTKLNVTTNDLLVGSVLIALNFTKKNIVISTEDTGPKNYAPLTCNRFSDVEGKVIFLRLHTLNSIASFNNRFNNINYIKALRDKYHGRIDDKSKDLYLIYDYILSCTEKQGMMGQEMFSDTFKVATIGSVDIDTSDLMYGKGNVTVIGNLRVEISTEGIIGTPIHDGLAQDYIQDKEVMKTLRANGVSCYIVDSQNDLKPRFINFLGKVREIPVIKPKDQANGLYLVSIDKNVQFSIDEVIPLNEIADLKYVYLSKEEATTGADLARQYAEESSRIKAQSDRELMLLKGENDRLASIIKTDGLTSNLSYDKAKKAMELEFSSYKADLEKKTKEVNLEYEIALKKLKEENEKTKQETERYKHEYDRNHMKMANESLYVKRDYEYSKYERDSTVETIKTVGAIAGLLAGGYALYHKFGS